MIGFSCHPSRADTSYGCILRIPPWVFIDSPPKIKYSEVLARCCAWALCVLRQNPPFGTGHRGIEPDQEAVTVQTTPKSTRGLPLNSSPEQDCLAVGKFEPVRVLRGN